MCLLTSPPFPNLANQKPLILLTLLNWTCMPLCRTLMQQKPAVYNVDGIGPKVLRSCALSLYQVIHHLLSICLWYCDIPSDWKLHCIIPMYKSGDKSVISNYRPISLLCSLSKVLERLVYDKVFVFIHRSVSKFQFGFLRSHSCLQQLLIFVSKVFDSFGDNCQMDSVYLDFRKAFDKVFPTLHCFQRCATLVFLESFSYGFITI